MAVKQRPDKPFGIIFDPKMQPGYQSRNKSLDSLSKGVDFTYTTEDRNAQNRNIVADKRDLKDVFNTFQDIRIMPSVILRKKVK